MKNDTTGINREDRFLYLLTFLAVCYPVTCGYLMNSGGISEWVARVGELAGNFSYLLFPSDALILEQNAQLGAMNANLWFLLPALIVKLTGKMSAAWGIFQLLLQAATLGTMYLMSRELLDQRGERGGCLFAVLLYMTCPYRLYVCYDAADLSQALVWMLLPLYVWGAARMLRGGSDIRRRLLSGVISAATLAGIAYANAIHFLILAGLTILAVLFWRKWELLLPVPVACVPAAPVLLRLFRYLFGGAYAQLNLPLTSIMENGYLPGEMLHMLLFQEGHPGLGLGLAAALLCGAWLLFVRMDWKRDRMCRFAAWTSVFLLILSLRAFPWDYAQRIGVFGLRLIPLLGSPAVFFGLAQPGLCVAGALGVSRMRQQEEPLVSRGGPFVVILACLFSCIYQCNLLVYNRMPL